MLPSMLPYLHPHTPHTIWIRCVHLELEPKISSNVLRTAVIEHIFHCQIVRLALEEDSAGIGDVTTLSTCAHGSLPFAVLPWSYHFYCGHESLSMTAGSQQTPRLLQAS